MQQLTERLSQRIHHLTTEQLAEVERFIEELQSSQVNHGLTHSAGHLSEPAFAAVWSNPEDEAYDGL